MKAYVEIWNEMCHLNRHNYLVLSEYECEYIYCIVLVLRNILLIGVIDS